MRHDYKKMRDTHQNSVPCYVTKMSKSQHHLRRAPSKISQLHIFMCMPALHTKSFEGKGKGFGVGGTFSTYFCSLRRFTL